MSLGSRLKELRKEKKLTQADLAKIFSLGESTISFYENNKRTPDFELLKRIAVFFNVSIDYLLGNIDVRNTSVKENGNKPFRCIDVNGLPDEAIEEVEKYIELIRLKYNQNENLKR